MPCGMRRGPACMQKPMTWRPLHAIWGIPSWRRRGSTPSGVIGSFRARCPGSDPGHEGEQPLAGHQRGGARPSAGARPQGWSSQSAEVCKRCHCSPTGWLSDQRWCRTGESIPRGTQSGELHFELPDSPGGALAALPSSGASPRSHGAPTSVCELRSCTRGTVTVTEEGKATGER